MPGNPKMQAFERHLEKLGGDEVIFDQIAAGTPIREIAEQFRGFLDGAPEFPSRTWMYTWIHRYPEREEAWEEAKRVASHALVEQAEDILENDGVAPVSSAEMSWLKERAGHKKWIASQFNKKHYGEDKESVNVNVDVGTLHLDALRQKGSMGERQVEEADYELLEDAEEE